jgi:WD40 repeat protein
VNPRVVRLLVLIPLALVAATVGVWAWHAVRTAPVEPPPAVEVETATVAGVTFEVEHRHGDATFRPVWGADTALVRRGDDFLDFADGVMVVNGLGFPTPNPGDVVRWNLTGPLRVNGKVQAAHPLQPRPLGVRGTDLRFDARAGFDAPRDTPEVAWSRAGRVLVSANGDGTARVWDADRAELRFLLPPDAAAVVRGGPLRAAVSPDGKTVAVAGAQTAEVTLWETGSGTRVATLTEPKGNVTALRFAQAGWLLEVRGSTLFARDLSGDRSKVTELAKVHTAAVLPVAVSADGSTVAVNDGSTIRVVALAFAGAKPRAAAGGKPLAAKTTVIVDRVTPEACFALSPDGKLLAVFDGERRVTLHPTSGPALVRRLRWRVGPDQQVRIGAMTFYPDGKTLAIGGEDNTDPDPRQRFDGVRLYDVESGRERGWVGCPWPQSLAVSGDGKTLAAGTRYGTGVRVWNTADLVAKE